MIESKTAELKERQVIDVVSVLGLFLHEVTSDSNYFRYNYK